MHWDYRTVADLAGVSYPTLIRANEFFLRRGIYAEFFRDLVKQGYKTKLITGEKVALDSSFVHTFSERGEFGSEEWNDWKKAYGFKVHLLIDCKTHFPISMTTTHELAADVTVAILLLKKGRPWLRKTAYVLGDKGYDDADLVHWVNQKLGAKAGIPIRNTKRGKNYTWEGTWKWFQLNAKGRTVKKSIYNWRSAIERVFARLKRTYHLGKEEMRGIINFTKNTYLALISYMLKQLWLVRVS